MFRWLLFSFSFICLTSEAIAGATVSPLARFELFSGYEEVKAGWNKAVPIDVRPGDQLEVSARVLNKRAYNDIDLFVCTDRDLQNFRNDRPSNCRGANRWRGQFTFKYDVASEGPHYLLINNSFSLILKKKLNIEVNVVRNIDPDLQRNLRKALEKWNEEIIRSFKIQPFDVSIAPCGTKNAYSESRTGNIRMCSELFFDLLRRDFRDAIRGILYHELGHTLLNLWGLPGWNSEETVDEFAIVMLYWAGAQEKVLDWINYNLANNSRDEALQMLQQGSRHPLSVQRVRNAKEILRNPGPVIQRWNKLLYPKMTPYGLKKVIEIAPKYADKALAAKFM